MDEVDIDNVEDVNELEARLYAQIHHEATETQSSIQIDQTEQANIGQNDSNYNEVCGDGSENYQTSSKTNKILSKRYWASGEQAVKQLQPQQNTKHCFIRNPFKAKPNRQPNIAMAETSSDLNVTVNKNTGNAVAEQSKPNETSTDEPPVQNAINNTNPTAPQNIEVDASASKSKKNKKNPAKMDQNNLQEKRTDTDPAAEERNLKINPVADWMKRNKNEITKKLNTKTSANLKQPQQEHGPFAKQKQKLEKAIRLANKKQKSKKAKKTAAAIAKQSKSTDIIDLGTDNDSDDSDVVLVPIPPTPTFTVDDSDEDDKNTPKEKIEILESIILVQEENALDSTDVQMSSISSFIKPSEISQHSHIPAVTSADKQMDNASRCTSPCSIQSSDDFIGQNDRSRLLAGASGMADDEDLLVLTSDMNSLLEAAKTTTKHNEDAEEHLDSRAEEHVENEQDSPEFLTPTAAKTGGGQKDYRVDQSQFRAVDVYESESDKTDSVYSKGAKRTTVIREIDSSSDDNIEEISSRSQRTKRLCKRRASSSNKESESGGNNEKSSSDNENDDNDPHDDNNALRTAIPFISRGPAVERCKPRKRTRTLSTHSPTIQTRKSAKTSKTASPAHMSDGEFIATLNNLAQGQDGEEREEADDSETENAPSARDIAEKILTEHAKKTTNNETLDSELAVPDEVCKELDKVFETIDHLHERDKQQNQIEPVNVTDSSDSNPENRITYKSLPTENTHIIQYVKDITGNNRTPAKKRAANGSPIYNVIYSRGQRNVGGIGWNEEMRKFYNDSWNGEHFVLKRILQKMNPEKHLWKIYTEDRFNTKSNRRYSMKCTNCCELGHMRSKCKRPKKPVICYMCGESGHHEPRCPNTICLRCGNKTQVFTKSCNSCLFQNRLMCPICRIRGHSLDFCPDKWRRYHSTTEPNAYPNTSVKYNTRKFCCICGGHGHLSDNCRSAVRFMEYPAILSAIKSHQKSYGDIPVKFTHGGIGFNLMYEPCQEFKFDMVDRTTNDKYYGRFLSAVGMEFMLKLKRHVNTATTDTVDKLTNRLSKKYIANPYSKVGSANQKDTETDENAPDQVQEITESCNMDKLVVDNQEKEIISLDENSVENDVELVGSSTVEDGLDMTNIEINTTNVVATTTKSLVENFKSTTVTSSLVTPAKSVTEPLVILDSDSNYSFSEHYDDVPSTSAEAAASDINTHLNESENIPTAEVPVISLIEEASYIPLSENSNVLTCSRPKPREMPALPDFIPLTAATDELDEEEEEGPIIGISNQFMPAPSDDDMEEYLEQPRHDVSPLPEIPCEAKIYLTHFHSKFLLSPEGHNFLAKTSKFCKMKARLDFTSIGHVLVIFGLPKDQNKFQRELLFKYRELTDQCNQKQLQASHNIPKKADVLVRFLRENITQLLNNLGNVNQLLNRLKYLENQQSKSGYKLAEKVRRSLNMILIGQAGLQDGSMHLDKLLLSLKTLVNDYADEDVAPQQLRAEITDHWKMIFTPYRHENYHKLVATYNRLISKNRVPQLSIDPLLLGQKVLDTTLTAEQKQKFEQPRSQSGPNYLNAKNSKYLKRKQTDRVNESSPLLAPRTSKANSSNKVPPAPPPPKIRSDSSNTTVLNKTKSTLDSSKTSTRNKIKLQPTTMSTTSPINTTTKKQQQQKIMPPPPFANPEKRSTVSTNIQQASDKWKSSCDHLLSEITDESSRKTDSRDSKLPSPFWSRESLRYLDQCMKFAATRPNVVEKLQRVQNKSQNGQLSYNDYLAVIKLHTALSGK